MYIIGGRVRELSTQCDSDIMFLDVSHLFKVLNWKDVKLNNINKQSKQSHSYTVQLHSSTTSTR